MADIRSRIAVLTSGGDAPGMNAAIRSVVRSGIARGAEVIGIEHGFEGLLEGRMRPLAVSDVGGVLDRGGTFLGTSRSARFETAEGVAQGAEVLRSAGIDGLLIIGGDGSYRAAEELHSIGVRVVGVPGTIDNDVAGTDTSIGFDTALNTVCDAVSKIRDTASSHERTFVIEVMGRSCGILATYAGLACGGDCILVPEVPWSMAEVVECVAVGTRRGKRHSLVILAEGAGHAFTVAEQLGAASGHEVRAVVLGYVQRGGSPSAFDRLLASRMGARAVEAILGGVSGVAVGLQAANVVAYPLHDAYDTQHLLRTEIHQLARVLAL
ncbi:MAG: 6-phosphofructokinase [Coriobacteriia bacterium]|nr:6-phosphofructokinase [Coriobacteriia bacterium]